MCAAPLGCAWRGGILDLNCRLRAASLRGRNHNKTSVLSGPHQQGGISLQNWLQPVPPNPPFRGFFSSCTNLRALLSREHQTQFCQTSIWYLKRKLGHKGHLYHLYYLDHGFNRLCNVCERDGQYISQVAISLRVITALLILPFNGNQFQISLHLYHFEVF